MSSIFTKIVNGEIPCYKIAEDENFLAFLDVNPNAKGHTLCIPKQEINKIFDIEDELYLGLMKFSKTIAIALEKTVPCKRIGMAVIGLEVPHAHVHLVPRFENDGHGGFIRPENIKNISKEEMNKIAEDISKNI